MQDIFEVFEVFKSFFVEGAMTIEDPLLCAHGYQLLPLAISQYGGDNKEFDVSDIF